MVCVGKKSAKIIYSGGGAAWVSPKQFWRWVKDGIVEYISEPPLTGKFLAQPEKFIVNVEHTLLDMSCPEHLQAVVAVKRQQRNRQ
jgi:hypothetical protein